ncbi:CRISPR-associated protein [Zhaonella formicivorans]|uniref:CRISPR-associated protein n=1 Tax=Zhaonella formicivorans TaxID=2528593 RepID=UPI0010D9FF55|nr:CRISPR-associated protein [Zhaonella formicivorans]
MIIQQNSDFLFGFEAILTNPNGDPDQENKPRMDYETSTVLVSDARRKRDVREILKHKGYPIFVDTLGERKVPMDEMFNYIIEKSLRDTTKINKILSENKILQENWILGNNENKYYEKYLELKEKKDKNIKSQLTVLNNLLLTELIKRELIDIRLFGSAMAVEGVSKTFTGPVQISWGYSLHPAELVKSNTITSIMNDDNSTFGKKYKIYYGLIAHCGTINKYSAELTGMTFVDREIFRKALVQGMMSNQTDSKQGQTPLFYLEILYKPEFDGYLGDLRRFLQVSYDANKAIRKLEDLKVDFSNMTATINKMKRDGYIERVVGWVHPFASKDNLMNMPSYELVDLWADFTN